MTPAQEIQLGGAWRVEVWRDWNFSAAHKTEWKRCADSAGSDGLFIGPEWFEIWWNAFGRPGQLKLLFIFENNRLRGVAPCQLGGNNPAGGPLESLTNDHLFFYDFAFDRSAIKETVAAFLSALPRVNGVSRVKLNGISGNSPVAQELLMAMRAGRQPFDTFSQEYSPVVDLAGKTVDTLLETLHSKLKNNLKKGRRKAEKEGALTFDVVDQPANLDALLSEAFEVENQSWKGSEGTSIKSDPKVEQFYRRVSRWALDQGCFHLYALRLNGKMVAFDLCLSQGKTMFALKTGYDQSVSGRFSPGNLMRFDLICHLINEKKIDCYNFLGPVYPWKKEWTQVNDNFLWLTIFPRTLLGRCQYECSYGVKNKLKRVLQAVRGAKS